MSLESPLRRWWNTIRPAPSTRTYTKAELAQKARQKKLLRGTLGLIVLSGGGWYAYDYITTAPQRAKAVLDQGMKQMGPGKYQDAIPYFDRAISIAADYADAYLYRGIAEHNLAKTDSALVDLDKATELNPNLVRAFDERGRIFFDKGDTAKAIDEFSKSIKIQPSTDAYYARAQAYEKLGDHQKALSDFDNAIVELRDAPYAYRARAMTKDALGDADGARQDRETAHQIDGR
jgi:tetratricopeptide (TPR) repeat protein